MVTIDWAEKVIQCVEAARTDIKVKLMSTGSQLNTMDSMPEGVSEHRHGGGGPRAQRCRRVTAKEEGPRRLAGRDEVYKRDGLRLMCTSTAAGLQAVRHLRRLHEGVADDGCANGSDESTSAGEEASKWAPKRRARRPRPGHRGGARHGRQAKEPRESTFLYLANVTEWSEHAAAHVLTRPAQAAIALETHVKKAGARAVVDRCREAGWDAPHHIACVAVACERGRIQCSCVGPREAWQGQPTARDVRRCRRGNR